MSLTDWFLNLWTKRSTLANPTTELKEVFGCSLTATGVSVNEWNGIRASAVWACVRRIAEGIAALPCLTYRRLEPAGRQRASDYPLYDLLHARPNGEMTAITFWELMAVHILQGGNCYAEIDYGKSGFRPLALWPLLPDRTTPIRDPQTGELFYRTTLTDGSTKDLPAWKVYHVPGMGFDGIIGYSPIKVFRESVALAIATEEYGSRFFGNGARPGGVLEHPGKLGDVAHKRLRESFEDMHRGLSNAQRLAILEEGMKYHQVQVAPEDAQFLETRKYQVIDIARIYGVPPHLIGELERSTNNNIEHQSNEFVIYCLRPWLIRFEQEINRKLIGPKERSTYYAEFLVDALLRGDFKTRQEGYAIGKQNGWLCADEIRELSNLNPLPDGQGKVYMVPMNYIPADKVEELAEAQIKKSMSAPGSTPGAANPDSDKESNTPAAARSLVDLLIEDTAERVWTRLSKESFGDQTMKRHGLFVRDALRVLCESRALEPSPVVNTVLSRGWETAEELEKELRRFFQ